MSKSYESMSEEEILEAYRRLPYEQLVVSVVQIKSEMIDAYDAINELGKRNQELMLMLKRLLEMAAELDEEPSAPTRHPGQYL